MTHLHITSWVLALLLFAVVLVLSNQGKEKPAKILQMILRLDYLLILYSGGDLFANYLGTGGAVFGEVIVKTLAGLWLIASMEMIPMKMSRGASATGWWIQWGIALVLVLALGFGRLPLGVQLF
ncbi:MAG: YisL family protein [Bacillaceae bacterium]|nr:YisL family protein [Bacillaceae bacterium]